MLKFSRGWTHAAICAALALLIVGIDALERAGHAGTFLLSWENRARDWVATTGRFLPPDPRLVYVGIDSASVSISSLDLQTIEGLKSGTREEHALQLMTAGWPWSREVHALIAERLLNAGARVVIFDLLFLKPANGDDALRATLEKFPGKIVLASNFVADEMGAGQVAWSLSPTTSSIVAGLPNPPPIGYVNFFPDFDGVVRSAQYWRTPEQFFKDEPPSRNPEPADPASLAARAARALELADIAQPFRAKLIRFTGPPGTFLPVPAYQIFAPMFWQRNFRDGELLRDKIVFVGPAGNWQHDEHATPFGQMPGPELHLNALNALLHGAFVTSLPHSLGILVTLALALLSWLLTTFLRQSWWRLAGYLTSLGLFILALKLAYNYLNLVVPAVSPLLALSLTGLASFGYDFTLETLEKLRVRRTLEAYVSPELTREILDKRDSFLHSLGGERKCAAVLLTDLRGFTALSEAIDSVQLVTQLNEYLSQMVNDIQASRGWVDKFIGDAILAVWGNLHTEGAANDITAAIRAALQMQKSLRRLNADWTTRGMPTLAMGCGINYGEVIFGNIGSSQKMEPTVIGDAVNVTSRLEGLTKEYGRELLVGEALVKHVRDRFTFQFVDRIAVKGKSVPLDIYTILSDHAGIPNESLASYLETYSTGIELFRAGNSAKAADLFSECLKLWPNDSLATLYSDRCRL